MLTEVSCPDQTIVWIAVVAWLRTRKPAAFGSIGGGALFPPAYQVVGRLFPMRKLKLEACF